MNSMQKKNDGLSGTGKRSAELVACSWMAPHCYAGHRSDLLLAQLPSNGGWCVHSTGGLIMKRIYLATRKFLREEEGVTAIEYALIAALIAVAIIVTVTAV